MNYQIQIILNNNPYFKKFLRENSFYYKSLIRNPESVGEIIDLMKKQYGLTLPDKLDKIKDNIHMINSVMEILN